VTRLMRCCLVPTNRNVEPERVVGEAIPSRGAPTNPGSAYSTPTFDLGVARVDLDHAVTLAADLDDGPPPHERDSAE